MKYMVSAIAMAALLAGSAHALPGNDKGNGGGNGKAKVEHSPMAKSPGNKPGNGKSNGNAGQAMKPNKPDKGPAMQSAMKASQGPARVEKKAAPAMAQANRPVKASKPDKAKSSPPGLVERGNAAPAVAARRNVEGLRVLDDGRRIYQRDDARQWWGDYERRGLIDGCPPGLAKKQNGCMPPGLTKARQDDYGYYSYRPDWWGLRGLLPDGGRYFYNDGYLLRLNGGNVAGYIPLLGGALSVGHPWPDYYAPRPVPDYYVSYYDLGPSGGYRYADDVLYRVDPTTQAITSIAALLTGDDIRVGQPMPRGYDVYNVPYQYRSQYVDGPNAYYRYSDGYVYQVDPETRLVAAAIELLAS